MTFENLSKWICFDLMYSEVPNKHSWTDIIFLKKTAMDSLIRPWTLIKFLTFAFFKYLLKAVSQAFYSTENGINKQFNPKTK